MVKPSGPGLDDGKGGRGGSRTRAAEDEGDWTGLPRPEPRRWQDLDAFLDAQDAIEKRNTSLMNSLQRDWLQASGERIKLIEFDRDAQLKALDDTEQSEQQLADARVLINKRASAEIIAERQRETDAVSQAQAGLLRQQGRTVDALGLEHAQRQAEIRGSGYGEDTQAQLLGLEEKSYSKLVADAEGNRFDDWLKGLHPAIQEVAEGFGEIGDSAVDAFSQAITEGKSLSESLDMRIRLLSC
jgi:hypothetical protein